MKRIGNLYSKIADIENVKLAHLKARKGKRHYAAVKRIDGDAKRYLNNICGTLAAKKFRTSTYEVTTKKTGPKTRVIHKLPYYPDRIVHHCVMNVLEPIWMSVFIRDTYSAIRGRGVHDGVRRIKQFLKDTSGTAYCLKIDVKKFYPSIDHETLKSIIRRKIKCRKTLSLLDEIIDSAPGVPIGNYLSQYFGNLYLAYFDHWCKEVLGIRYYSRYCDDIVIFGPDKALLHNIFYQITEYLLCNLGIEINKSHQVFPTRVRGVDFLGYRFFGNYTIIRKRIAKQFKRRVSDIKSWKSSQTKKQKQSAFASYHGWFKHADAYRLWNKYAGELVIYTTTIR